MIRPASEADAAAICSIYNHYVLNTCITFEEEPVHDAEMRRRIQEVTEALPWNVLHEGDDIVGFAYASRWKSR